ncbi:MAG: ribonuclease R [Opitutales bacterium]|nr:ribonuclease R [Opitutales bacterium]
MRSKGYVPIPVNRIAEQLKVPNKDLGNFRGNVDELIRSGTIVRLKKDRLCFPHDAELTSGYIRFRQNGSATLIPDPLPDGERVLRNPIIIKAEDTGVAMHGDKVLIRLIRSHRRYVLHKGKNGMPESVLEEPTGRVIRILERARSTLTGTLQKSRHTFFVIADDPRISEDIIVSPPSQTSLDKKVEIGDKVIVKLADWTQRHLNPEGEIIDVLGKTHTPQAEFAGLLHQYGLNPEFPEAVMAMVAKFPSKVSSKDCQNRLDLRKKQVFTIDPDDAKDFDDALSIEKQEDGTYRVGIHIADVSHYVKRGSVLDRDAQARGNSTYLVGKVIPMLPHALSNGLCSLVEREDRLTKSVFITFSEKGKLIESETEFANTVICSTKRLTYKQAYALLFENDLEKVRQTPLPPAHQTGSTGRALSEVDDTELKSLQHDVRMLWYLGNKMRKYRMDKGSLDFDVAESKIYVDEDGWADRIVKVEHDESHQLVEEFMLAANEAVARTLVRASIPLIHRVHDKPDPEKLNELRDYMETVGIHVGDLNKRKEVTKLLQLIKAHPQSHVLRVQFLRSLRQACYRSSSDGHYGLNKVFYTHFTSPIRRYSDLVVHRIFDAYMGKQGNPTASGENSFYKPGNLTGIAQHLSLTEQNSTDAERESVKIKQLEFFERECAKPEEERSLFEAVIVDMRNHGFFVELTESMAYGMVHVSTLKDDLYILNKTGNRFTGKRRNKKFSIGGKINVIAHRVDRYKRQIDFQLPPEKFRKGKH